MSDLFRTHGSLLATAIGIFAATLFLCTGCAKDSETDDQVRRPAPVLTDDKMERMLGAIKDLKALLIAQATARELESGVEDPHIHGAVGPGMSSWVEGSAPILKRWGFQTAEEFEGLHAYSLLALQQIILGKDGGVQQASKRFYIQQGIEGHRRRIADTKADEMLSEAERRGRITESEHAIAEFEDTMQEDEENAAMMRGQSERLPPQNVIVMEKYKDQYLELKLPHG